MSPVRMDERELERVLDSWSPEWRELVRELRDLVLDVAPQVDEGLAFGCLSYTLPDRPYGAIGGSVCLIGPSKGRLHLGFLHGACLPDPAGLLEGRAKYKRTIPLASARDVRPDAFRALVRASVAFDPRTLVR